MTTLFNDDWSFCEIPIDEKSMYDNEKPVLLCPDSFFAHADSLNYVPVRVPHDWLITDAKALYRNSVGFYKKVFTLDEKSAGKRTAIRFEGVYMNCGVWINGKKAGEWKYGYSTFEFDISKLVHSGENTIQVIAVYQNCNTRWYSGAGIFRDVTLITSDFTHIPTDGIYFSARPVTPSKLNENWAVEIETEICSKGDFSGLTVINQLIDRDKNIFAQSKTDILKAIPEDESLYRKKNIPALDGYNLAVACDSLVVKSPNLWDTEKPYIYTLKTQLVDINGTIIEESAQNCGFKFAVFDKDDGFFLNGRHLKINGACHHHDHGAFGSAFNVEALRRQFVKLQEMGINSIRCSHNPPPKAWMNLADEMGLLIDDECFDMWEKTKTPFDYGNYFNEWHEKDTISWVRKDRNHPCLIMWSIGNEIYDTHVGNGFEITKQLSKIVEHFDPKKNGLITIASNYMMTDGAQNCAKEIDVVGYNYLERLYDEHHKKYGWKIYGSETSSTVQSRGIYHFPQNLTLVTYDDLQCSSLGNCTTTWGARSTEAVITGDRDKKFSAGQYLWTGWDYIGEPTPYHTKNSYFGQIDTAGFPKDSFFLYKSAWTSVEKAPFVHLLPYWDWNIGQKITVRAYTNASSIELFVNGKSRGLTKIDHKSGLKPFGQWDVIYEKGEIKAVGYDENGKVIAEDLKRSFGDPAKIIIQPERNYDENGKLFFVDLMAADKDGILVENARNYITLNVTGDAELVGMDNGDSTDYDQYVPENGNSHSRKLFGNRLVAIIRKKSSSTLAGSFIITAASKELPTVSLKWDGHKWLEVPPYYAIRPEKDFIPVRKIEIETTCCTELTDENREISVSARVLPENASIKEIKWMPVLKECVKSDYVEIVEQKNSAQNDVRKIRAVADGECILRCTSDNGKDHVEVISDLNITVSGVGNPMLNPYKLIEACRMSRWNEERSQPPVSLESGISNRGIGETWISFDKVDFGKDGADVIHYPVFSFAVEEPVEIWDGIPNRKDSVCILKDIYRAKSVYNTFTENTFTLNRRLFGVHTISIVLKTELVIHGFYFDKTPKAFAKLNALNADDIVGNTFKKGVDCVEGIGNNVNLDFSNMNFGDKKATKLTVCGKSNTDNNTINIKFFDEEGNATTQVIDFAHTDEYEIKTFDISPVTGNQKVSFVFLPGCNFDFKWFKFEEN